MMLRAVVIGNLWSTKRIEGLPAGAFLEVQVEDSGSRLIAFDVLGTGVGERILVAQGSVAAAWFPGPPPPVDALVIGSIDTAVPPADIDPAATSERAGA
ncbi:EutN/CcmL family microcompartment protein [Spirillospora sp. CA-255316]